MIRRLSLLLAAFALATLAASPAAAYWEYGHETIARIAMLNVKPQTRATVIALLSHAADLDTPQCPARTPEQASVWPDCIKKLGDRFRNTFVWHYQDVNICAPFALPPECAEGDCVSAQITRDVATLKDTRAPRIERLKALVFLIHFVGDLHQPLHAGEKGDAGGNKVTAAYGIYAPPRLNLHSVWDGLLAERAISTPPTIVRRYAPAEKARLQAGDVPDWSRETAHVAHDSVYGSAMADPCAPTPAKVVLDEATIERLVPVAQLQVERGGLRLAKLLDQALG
ncbi:S1/P1 nuclease [Hephaestia sp. GCM10023244]|uniref:S1/P1 nuclease n=1 Tax=unclassified Hephaestia TaxID=2631281 RepID=UPI002076F70E|nr:S1/P1 nuclease [Hephaestia sp. MAHUQ-44]MCM8730475.1 S1/P1 nuclease [Hephaestia sp. MAHUQ-44]